MACDKDHGSLNFQGIISFKTNLQATRIHHYVNNMIAYEASFFTLNKYGQIYHKIFNLRSVFLYN